MSRTISTGMIIVASGVFPVKGEQRKCDVMRLGSKLRIVDAKTDRSISSRGYADLAEVRKEFPGSI